jgi:hypothetical protein
MTFREIRGFVEMVVRNDEDLLLELDQYSQHQIAHLQRPFNVDWCICGYCIDSQRMTDVERKCCRERHCVSRTKRCQNMVTDNDVVTTAANTYNDVTVRKKELDNKTLRHAAYRNYVMWKYGHLGKNNRVVIPSCVVWLIRNKWPAADGVYTGFKTPH